MWKYNEPTIFRSEEWHQREGKGILELRGSKLDIVLFINGEPLAYHAHDCEGSVARFIVLFSDNPLESNQLISQAAAKGFTETAPLHEQISPLLPLFPDGTYQMRLEQIHDYDPDPHLPADPNYSRYRKNSDQSYSTQYYPVSETDVTLVQTQSESSLDEETINDYATQIIYGLRPAMITVGLKNHWSRLILDGHHKLMAYRRCNVGPVMLHIEFQEIEPISNELANHVLRHHLEQYKDYLWDKNYDNSP